MSGVERLKIIQEYRRFSKKVSLIFENENLIVIISS